MIVIRGKKYWICRRLGMLLPQNMILEAMLRIYIDGYLSICICCLISLEAFTSHENPLNSGDTFAIIYCVISICILILLPTSIFLITFKYKKYLKDKKKLGRYAILFTDLKRDGAWQIVYHALFFFRRFLLSILLVLFKDEGNL